MNTGQVNPRGEEVVIVYSLLQNGNITQSDIQIVCIVYVRTYKCICISGHKTLFVIKAKERIYVMCSLRGLYWI